MIVVAFFGIWIILSEISLCIKLFGYLGFCGTATRSRALLIIYAMMVFILMIATLASGIYLYYKRDGVFQISLNLWLK